MSRVCPNPLNDVSIDYLFCIKSCRVEKLALVLGGFLKYFYQSAYAKDTLLFFGFIVEVTAH